MVSRARDPTIEEVAHARRKEEEPAGEIAPRCVEQQERHDHRRQQPAGAPPGRRTRGCAEDVVISARALGKAKTLATLAGLGLLFLAADALTGGPIASIGAGEALELIGFWLMVAATVLTVVSGLAYLRGAWPILVGRLS